MYCNNPDLSLNYRLMKEVAFITDADTQLGEELVNIYLNNGFNVFATVSQSGDEKEKINELREFFIDYKDYVEFEIWNRKSPASSKNILLKVFTAYKTINRVFILGNPVLSNLSFNDINFMNIEFYIDSFVKGNVFLIKEIIKYFKENNNPDDIIALINFNANNPELLLDEIIKNSFLSITRSLLEINKDNSMIICGFESKSKKYEEFANYIYRLIENKTKRISGRLLKFTSGIIPGIIR